AIPFDRNHTVAFSLAAASTSGELGDLHFGNYAERLPRMGTPSGSRNQHQQTRGHANFQSASAAHEPRPRFSTTDVRNLSLTNTIDAEIPSENDTHPLWLPSTPRSDPHPRV